MRRNGEYRAAIHLLFRAAGSYRAADKWHLVGVLTQMAATLSARRARSRKLDALLPIIGDRMQVMGQKDVVRSG